MFALFLFDFFAAAKKDGDDGSGDQVDIPKRTTPAKGMHISFLFKSFLSDYAWSSTFVFISTNHSKCKQHVY